MSTIQPSSSTAGTRVPFMAASPPSTDHSICHGRATAVRTSAPPSSPYAITPSGSGAASPSASPPWSDSTK